MSALDGMNVRKAKDAVQAVMSKYGKGLFSDQYWKGVQNIIKAFDKADIDYSIDKTEYGASKTIKDLWRGRPINQMPDDHKKWTLTFSFVDDKGKKKTFGGQITAHGAGSVEDPLSKYDISAYVY